MGIKCACECVFSPDLFWRSSSLDVPAGVTQEEGHTGFLIHLPSADGCNHSNYWRSNNGCLLTKDVVGIQCFVFYVLLGMGSGYLRIEVYL